MGPEQIQRCFLPIGSGLSSSPPLRRRRFCRPMAYPEQSLTNSPQRSISWRLKRSPLPGNERRSPSDRRLGGGAASDFIPADRREFEADAGIVTPIFIRPAMHGVVSKCRLSQSSAGFVPTPFL